MAGRARCRFSAFLCSAALAALGGCGGNPEGPGPAVFVYDPPNDELWVAGTTRVVTWYARDVSLVRIELLRGGAGPAELIADDVDATLGSYAWPVTGPDAAGSVIVITDTSDPTVSGSSDPFDILPAGVYLFEPSGGEYLSTGTSREITWLADAAIAAGIVNVRIEISRDNGGSWTEDIVASTDASTGSYTWPVTDGGMPLPQTQCLVRVSDADDAGVNATTAAFIVYSGVLHVDLDAASGGDGLSWATAFRHPQDAMDVALPGSEVWVAEGTYTRRAPEDTVLVTMAEGVALYGGFLGNEAARASRDWNLHEVVLDGEDVCEHVVVGADNGRLDGFTATRGNAPGSVYGGGGMCNEYVSVTVENCVFSSCHAYYGGGVLSVGGTLAVSNCGFFGNDASHGTGISSHICAVTVTGTIFAGNTTPNRGGALQINDSTILLVDSVVVGNDAGGGGGLFCESTASSWRSSPAGPAGSSAPWAPGRTSSARPSVWRWLSTRRSCPLPRSNSPASRSTASTPRSRGHSSRARR